MTAQKKILAGVLLLIAVLGVAWEISRPRIPDPIIDGKHLTYWLGTYPIPGSIPLSRVQVERVQADSAVCEAGTNAIPLLLRYISARDSVFKLKMMNWAAKQHIIRFPLEYARNRRSHAEFGFQALGAQGSNAVPELIRIYETDTSSPNYFIIQTFGCIGPSAEVAVPLVLKAATNSNTTLRTLAIHSLGQMRVQPEKSVPVLTGALKDTVPWIRRIALQSLRDFGPQANEAVPEVIKLRSEAHAWEMEHPGFTSGPSPVRMSDIDEAIQKSIPSPPQRRESERTRSALLHEMTARQHRSAALTPRQCAKIK